MHVYIHVPFCARRCVYCDFSIAVRRSVPVEEYVRAVGAELAHRHAAAVLDLDTLYFGGGTPTKLGAEGVARLVGAISEHASIRSSAEVTLEANPEDISADAARAWRAAGVNRVSLGVQSFEDPVLSWMHRTHDSAAAHRAIESLRDAGLTNISIDLIFAAPSAVARTWERDLDTAVALELPHISVYGLTVEERTPLGRRVARHDLSEAPFGFD